MKKVYHLLSVALLGAMALTSCEEDKIVNENNGEGNETDKNLTDYSFIASIKQSAPLGRSNLQNGVYTWNKGDAVTLWNRNFGAGYDFSITPGYNDNQPDKSAEFTGKAAVENGHKLIAVFPRKEAKTFNDLATFSMPETFTQTGKTAELAATTYMVATGDVTDNKIPALTFSPLTALIQFGLKNTSDRELKIRYITLESDDDVFPAELKIDEDGVVQSLSGMRNKLTLDMSGQALAQNETLNGYLNILPTTYGDTRLMKSTTELNITVSVLNNEVEQDIILLKKVKVKDLEDNIGLDMDATANQFAAGKHYKMDFEVDYRFRIPDEGYMIDDDGNIHIYNKTGLFGWNKIADEYRKATVTLEKEYIDEPAGDGIKVIDMGNELWEPISAFGGVFEGNGVTIRNLQIANKGFIATNTGTIRNLTLENVSFSADITEGAGALAAESSTSVIQNCTVKGVTVTVIKPVVFGGLIGRNSEGRIEGCQVISGTINLNLSGAGNSNYGGLVGEHFNGTALIINSYVGADVTIKHPSNSSGASCVGGLVGWNNSGKVKGCYSLAKLEVSCSGQVGGLIGANSNGTVLACYVAGSISGTIYNKNEITELYNGVTEYVASDTGRMVAVGHPLGEFYLNRYAGVNPINGDALWYTKDGEITMEYNESDKVMLGKTHEAPWQGGFGTTLFWKGFSLSAQFTWVADRWMLNNDRVFQESNGLFSAYNQSKRMLYDRWKKPGDVTDIPRYGVTPQLDSRFLEDASFLRLKNLMLSYTFPQKWLKRTSFLNSARIYAQGQNLLTFTNFTGMDPESTSNVYKAQYPMSRQFTFGLEVSF